MSKFLLKTKISCGDHIHEIGISKKGRFAIFNHPGQRFKRWDAFADLGGEMPNCMQVFHYFTSTIKNDTGRGVDRVNWQWGHSPSYTNAFRGHVLDCMEKRRARRCRHERGAHQR